MMQMAQRTLEKYRVMLKKTISSIGTENLLSIEDIGKPNSKVSLAGILESMGSFSGGLDVANYCAHFGEYSRLGDFVELGLPEYTLDRLIAFNYLQQRAEEIIIPAQEELLQSSLESLITKYGREKVTQLKKRLGIEEIHYH